MKKILICALIILSVLSGCTAEKTASDKSEPRAENTKFTDTSSSGVWLSFSEINSMLLSAEGFKVQFDKAVENCRTLGIENMYIHVRSYCDSLFKSEYFPLIDEAAPLDYNAFEYAVNACHRAGIKVHAWINPYRVTTKSVDISLLSPESPAYKWLNDDNAENDINVIRYNGIYLNPAETEVRELVINGIREILSKYDVDGIHFDDYFYPTTDAEFDSASYEKYKAEAANPLPLDEWRRANVNALISGCYTAVKYYNKDILFTVSPMASLEKNYNELYADVREWVKSGCIDYIIPQLYFGFDYPDPAFGFSELLSEWKELMKCNSEVGLLIGLGVYKTGTDAENDREEWQNNTDIIARQAKICYSDGGVSGYVLFSYSSLFSNAELNVKQRENFAAFKESCK